MLVSRRRALMGVSFTGYDEDSTAEERLAWYEARLELLSTMGGGAVVKSATKLTEQRIALLKKIINKENKKK